MHQLFVFLAACVAGAINAVAGGGTLVTFPTLVWLGVPAVNANMTNTVSLWPGSLGGFWGYRRELRDAGRLDAALARRGIMALRRALAHDLQSADSSDA